MTIRRLPHHARQLGELHRTFEREGVHLLAWFEAKELRLFFILRRADDHVRPEPPHTHRDRLAALWMVAEIAGLIGLFAADVRFFVAHPVDEWLPEFLEQRHPVLLTTRDFVQPILEPCCELVVHVILKVVGQKIIDE